MSNGDNEVNGRRFRAFGSVAMAGLFLVFAALDIFHYAGEAYGQDSPDVPVSKVERKNRAPVSSDILRVVFPKPIEKRLPNGLTVLIVEDHRFPAVFVQLYIPGAGALFDPSHLPGLANATAQMLHEGTRSRTSRQIAEEVDRLGATIDAGSGFGSTEAVLSASGLSDNFDEWFALAAEILLQPSFPAAELDRLKHRLKSQLRQQRSSSRFLLNERFQRAVYGNHPAAVVSPTPESVDHLTPELLTQWHRDRYAPDQALLGIAGDVRAAELIPKLEKFLGGWQSRKVDAALPPDPVPAVSRKVYLVDRPDSVQTTVALGNIAIDRRSEDYIPMVVMNHVLGGGPAARLFLNLREEKGYTYGVYSSFTAREYPGPWRAGGDVRTEVTAGALAEFAEEFRRIREERVPAAELEEAKRSVVASFALLLEQPTRALDFAVTRKIYDLPEDYWDAYPAKIAAVTADDVQRVARKYLDSGAMQLVAVGDGRKIMPILVQYGPVEVYDSAGNPVQDLKK